MKKVDVWYFFQSHPDTDIPNQQVPIFIPGEKIETRNQLPRNRVYPGKLGFENFPIYYLFLDNIYGSEKIQKRNIPLSFSSLIFLADDYQPWQQVKGH